MDVSERSNMVRLEDDDEGRGLAGKRTVRSGQNGFVWSARQSLLRGQLCSECLVVRVLNGCVSRRPSVLAADCTENGAVKSFIADYSIRINATQRLGTEVPRRLRRPHSSPETRVRSPFAHHEPHLVPAKTCAQSACPQHHPRPESEWSPSPRCGQNEHKFSN